MPPNVAQFLAPTPRGAKSAIDMEPQFFFLRDVRELIQIVDGTDIDRACCSGQKEGTQTLSTIRLESVDAKPRNSFHNAHSSGSRVNTVSQCRQVHHRLL